MYLYYTFHLKKITHGFPQGSTLGPLLFILYFNDTAYYCSDILYFTLYADDTNVFYSLNIISILTDTLKMNFLNCLFHKHY